MDNYNYDINNNNSQNGQNNSPYNNPYNKYENRPKETDYFSLASLIIGILSVFASIVFYIGIPCSVVAVVLACISRGRKGRFEGKAIAGLCLGISSFIIALFMFALMLKMLNSPELVNAINNFYQQTNQ